MPDQDTQAISDALIALADAVSTLDREITEAKEQSNPNTPKS